MATHNERTKIIRTRLFSKMPYDNVTLGLIRIAIDRLDASPQKEAARVISAFLVMDLNRGGIVPKLPKMALEVLDELMPMGDIDTLFAQRDAYENMVANFENEIRRLRSLETGLEEFDIRIRVPQIAIRSAWKNVISGQTALQQGLDKTNKEIETFRAEGGGADDDDDVIFYRRDK